MPDTNAAPTAAPAAATTTVDAPAAAPPAPTNAASVALTSDQLKVRLDETRASAETKLLKSLGFEKAADAAEFMKTAKAAQQAQMTEQEKLANSVKELTPRAERATALEQQLTAIVDEQFAALSDPVKAAIDSVAAGNAEKRLELMRVMRTSGLLTTTPGAPAPPAGPANAAPPANTPPPATTQTKFDEWSALEKDPSKRMQSAIFFNVHKAEIERTRPAT